MKAPFLAERHPSQPTKGLLPRVDVAALVLHRQTSALGVPGFAPHQGLGAEALGNLVEGLIQAVQLRLKTPLPAELA